MKKMPRLFVSFVSCLMLALVSGCESRVSLDEKYTTEHGNDAIVHYLQAEQGDGINKSDIESLVAKGADVNAKAKGGYTPLHFAAVAEENAEIVEFLVSNGADVNAKTDTGSTPLHVAAVNGNVEIVKFLVSKGADVNAKNNAGKTPLDLAKSAGNTTVMEYLSDLK